MGSIMLAWPSFWDLGFWIVVCLSRLLQDSIRIMLELLRGLKVEDKEVLSDREALFISS